MPEDDPIWYVYVKATGEYSGNGITHFDDEIYGSTLIEPPPEPEGPVLKFDTNTETWTWWAPLSSSSA